MNMLIVDDPAAGGKSLNQARECWMAGVDPAECARTHYEFARAFESVPHDAGQLFPEWREKPVVKAA